MLSLLKAPEGWLYLIVMVTKLTLVWAYVFHNRRNVVFFDRWAIILTTGIVLWTITLRIKSRFEFFKLLLSYLVVTGSFRLLRRQDFPNLSDRDIGFHLLRFWIFFDYLMLVNFVSLSWFELFIDWRENAIGWACSCHGLFLQIQFLSQLNWLLRLELFSFPDSLDVLLD